MKNNTTFHVRVQLASDTPLEPNNKWLYHFSFLSCEYGALKDELMRNRLVLGKTDEAARCRLLREKDLRSCKAVKICRAAAEVMGSKLETMSPGSPRARGEY